MQYWFRSDVSIFVLPDLSSAMALDSSKLDTAHFPWYKQPLKAAFLTSRSAYLIFIYAPLTSLWYLRPSSRPSPTWTLTTTVAICLMREFLNVMLQSGLVVDLERDLTVLPSDEELEK